MTRAGFPGRAGASMAVVWLLGVVVSLPVAAPGQELERSESGLDYVLRPGNDAKPRELWLLLHGKGDTAGNFLKLWTEQDCLEAATLVVPQAPRRMWRADDLERVSRLLDELVAAEHPDRVYVAGYSMGGGFLAYSFALRERERLDGLLVSSAATESPPPAAGHDLPVYHIHGTLDQKVPFAAGERSVQALHDAGYSMVALRPLVNTNHVLRDWAVATGVAWLRARSDLPAADDPAAMLQAARAARDDGDDARARVLAELVLRRAIGADVEELRESATALLDALETQALKEAKQIARQIVKAKGKNRTWQPREDLLRATHPTAKVLEVLDEALAELKAKHEERAKPLLEKGLENEAKGDYRRAMGSWAQIQGECFLADSCRIADQKINHYYTDPAIRKALGLR